MAIQAKPRGYLFEEVPDDQPQRSAFDLSKRHVMSCDFDYLYPFLCEDVIPNSDYELRTNIFLRTAPLVAPIFQDVDVKIYHYWVPARIIFRKWKKLISNGDGSVSIADALAAKKLVDMPFITNYDLAQRGNYSYTDPNGIRQYYVQAIPADQLNTTGTGTANIMAGTGESAGSLADYLGIPNTFLLRPSSELGLSSDGSAGLYAFGTVPPAVQYASEGRVYVSGTWSTVRANTFDRTYMDQSITWDTTDSAATLKTKNTARFYQFLRTYNSLPFRAYNKIYYDWFRDENLQPDSYNDQNWLMHIKAPIDPNTGEPVVFVSEYYQTKLRTYLYDSDRDYYNSASADASWDKQLNVGLLRKSFTKDYLTSALPSPQRGADVMLPVSGSAKLVNDKTTPSKAYVVSTGTGPGASVALGATQATGVTYAGSDGNPANIDITPNTTVDLSNVTSLTIEALRVANKMQQFLEKFARTGSRYVEMMLSHFDTLVPDAASERPTLIATSRIPIQISANSSESAVQIGNDVVPQGTQVGQAMTSGNTGYRFHCDEHGYLMSLLCIEPRTYYGSTLERHWLRRGWLDYAWPKFANLGEQPVYSCEVLPIRRYGAATTPLADPTELDSTMTGLDAYNMQTFGYQSRYCDYKYKQDSIAGDFRSNLSSWTLARFKANMYGTAVPQLNSQFIICDAHLRQNIFYTVANKLNSVTSVEYHGDGWNFTDHFWFDMRIDFKSIKPLPLFGVPTL